MMSYIIHKCLSHHHYYDVLMILFYIEKSNTSLNKVWSLLQSNGLTGKANLWPLLLKGTFRVLISTKLSINNQDEVEISWRKFHKMLNSILFRPQLRLYLSPICLFAVVTKIVFKEKCSEQFLIRNFPGTKPLTVVISMEKF